MTDNRQYDKELVVLAADKDMEFIMRGILERPQSLGIEPISFETFRHRQKDPGCLLEGHDFLRPFANKYRHALLMLDRRGCGKDHIDREILEVEIEKNLKVSGWGDRAAAIVIDPELENWIWSHSPKVNRALGWKGKTPSLRAWLIQKGFLLQNDSKPAQPKEALRKALRNVQKPWSSSIFYQIAANVSLKHCTDPAFLKLKQKLVSWFPAIK